MNGGHSESDSRFSRTIIHLQDNYSSKIMESRSRKLTPPRPPLPQQQPQQPPFRVEYHHLNHQRFLTSQGSGRRLLPASYFSLESLLLLICLAASLLILPLILPPLPPPPFLLLLLPIGILAVLMILAFMPTNAKDITYTCV